MKLPSGQELAKRIEAFSPYLTQVSRRDPALAQELFEQGGFQQRHSRSQLIRKFRKRLNGIDDFQTFALALRQIKQEVVLRIAARDLSGLAKFRETVQDLSALAEVSLQEALGFLQKDFTKTASRPAVSEREGGLLILALGKFGGEELNFSSDIDLIFLYQPLRNREPSPLEQKEQFLYLARKVVQAMGSLIGGDQVFRVDLGLRPGGKDSELVISLDSALEYYQTEARTWERMALIKARPVAGNLLLGKTFLKEVLPVVYRKYVDYTVLADIRAMKEKILEEAGSHWMKGEDIKLGPGGIREVEFVAQSLQMVFGGRIPALQERNTLKALEKLKEQGLLPNREFRDLTQAYVFLRTLEHRLQMVHQRQTHSLPKEPSALASLAREMPLKWQRQAADASPRTRI